MNVTISIKDDMLNDDRLKAQHVYTFLQLVKIANDGGIAIVSGKELMDLVKCKDLETVLKYIKVLIDAEYVTKLEPINRKSAYQLNKYCYWK